jgi:peptidyl-prolyl cis-trans isomerase C
VLLSLPARSADPNAVALQVGSRTVSVSELEGRWLALPAFQRRALGDSNPARLRAFIDRWLVPDLLLSQATQRSAAPRSARAQLAEQLVLQQALVDQLRQQTERQDPVTRDDVLTYFEGHKDLFEQTERLRLFRILLADRKSAEELLQKLKNAPDFDTWRNLAREQSLDLATRMRGGELGFVSADGKSDIVELQVDPVLFQAAARLKDGELAKTPIPEGAKFAVLWRRGHTEAQPARLAPSNQAAIREHLKQARAQAALSMLVQELKAKHVRELHPEVLDGVTFEASPSDTFSAATTQ